MHQRQIVLILIPLLCLSFLWQEPPCPPEGRGKKRALSTREKITNRLKNRHTVPKDTDIVKEITLQQLLNSGDDSLRFDDSKAVRIEGYIYKAVSEEGESCNCYSTNPAFHDTHIYLSPEPLFSGKALSQCAVIETTPYSRKLHPEWTTEYINLHFAGKKVCVTGWLLYDYKHRGQSQQSKPEATGNKRRTVWEIHPVTGMDFCN